MNLVKVKKGLSLIAFGIFIQIAAFIASIVIVAINNKATDEVYVRAVALSSLITTIVSMVAYVLNLIGLGVAGKGNKHFRRAFKLTIGGIIFTIVSSILMSIYLSTFSGENGNTALYIASNWMSAIALVCDFFVIFFVVGGCKSVANVRVNGTIVSLLALLPTVLNIVFSIMSSFQNLGDNVVLFLVLTIVYIVSELLKTFFYIVLIFRTNKQVKKKA